MVAQDVEMIEEENEETILVNKIKKCLEKVATPNIDAAFFVNSGVSMLVPLNKISRRSTTKLEQDPPNHKKDDGLLLKPLSKTSKDGLFIA